MALRWRAAPLLLLLLLAMLTALAMARQRIPDDLSDVVDDEEDEEWKAWGTKEKKRDGEDADGGGGGPMGGQSIEELMKQLQTGDSGKQMDTLGMSETGLQLCFCRLKEDPKRTKEDVDQLAGQWKSLLMTGGADETVYAIDEGMILISMDASRLREIREFVLSQPQAHGFESGGKIWVLAGEDDDGRPTYAVEPPPSSRPPPPPPKRAKRKKAKKRRAGTHGEL